MQRCARCCMLMQCTMQVVHNVATLHASHAQRCTPCVHPRIVALIISYKLEICARVVIGLYTRCNFEVAWPTHVGVMQPVALHLACYISRNITHIFKVAPLHAALHATSPGMLHRVSTRLFRATTTVSSYNCLVPNLNPVLRAFSRFSFAVHSCKFQQSCSIQSVNVTRIANLLVANS